MSQNSKDGSFILVGRSFQIVGPQTLNDLGTNVTVLVLGMYSCPEVADRNCLRPGIAEDDELILHCDTANEGCVSNDFFRHSLDDSSASYLT